MGLAFIQMMTLIISLYVDIIMYEHSSNLVVHKYML